LGYVLILDTGNFNNYKYSKDGVSYAFENYKNSIAVGTAFLAILAIYLTMRRLSQTQTQLQVVGANNQFNNFYKHREEFIKSFLKKPYITSLALAAGRSNEEFIINCHGLYFGTNYYSFDASIKSDRMKEMQIAFRELENISMPSNNFEEIISKGKFKISEGISLSHLNETNNFLTKKHEEYKPKFAKWEDTLDTLRALCNLYYDCKIKLQILNFSGEEHKVSLPADFIKNFETFLNKSGLYILIV